MTRSTMTSSTPGAGRRFLCRLRPRGFFAVWGLIGGARSDVCPKLSPLRQREELDDCNTALLGARKNSHRDVGRSVWGTTVFAALLLFSSIPAAAIGLSNSYAQLLGLGLLSERLARRFRWCWLHFEMVQTRPARHCAGSLWHWQRRTISCCVWSANVRPGI